MLNTIGTSSPHQAAQLTMGMTPKKRKRSSSSKENTSARCPDQFQGVQPRQIVNHQRAMSDVQDMMKIMKEDISRHRSFERRTEKHLQEVSDETRLLRQEVQSFMKQL